MDYVTAPSTSSSRSVTADLQSEIDEMNNILEVERHLVIQTQDNYKQLKKKYLQLQEENEGLKKELSQLKLYVTENERLHSLIADLEKRSREIVQNLSEDSHEREVQYIQFRTDSLAEVQRVFRKEISDQKLEMQRMEREKEDLMEENDKLLEAIRELNSQLLKTRRDLKHREHEMSMELSHQMDDLLNRLNDSREDLDRSSIQEIIEQQRERILKLELEKREAEELKLKASSDLHDKIRKLEEDNMIERKTAIVAEAKSQRAHNEILTLRLVNEQKQKDLDAVRTKLNNALRERLALELQISERERKLELEHQDQSMVFREKLTELEYYINEKDLTIEDLQRQLMNTRVDDNMFEQHDRSPESTNHSHLKMKAEIDNLNYEHNQKLLELKMERNYLEETVAELKRRLETSPETIAEAGRLRKELIEKEEEIMKLKEHYRDLLRRMKQSLLSLEKKYRRAQRKLDESIII